MENALRALGATTTGAPGCNGRCASTAAAPFATACGAYSAPSALTPGSAAKSAPGVTRRESTASARTSTPAAPGGTVASIPAHSSPSLTSSPFAPLLLRLPGRRQHDLHPCSALDNRTRPRRLAHGAPAPAQLRLQRSFGQLADRRSRAQPRQIGHHGLAGRRRLENRGGSGRPDRGSFRQRPHGLLALVGHDAELPHRPARDLAPGPPGPRPP